MKFNRKKKIIKRANAPLFVFLRPFIEITYIIPGVSTYIIDG